MEPHPVDPVALIAGLLFAVAGTTIIVERNWDGVDVTAFTAAGVALAGLLLAAMIVSRSVRDAMGRSGELDPASTESPDPVGVPIENPDDTQPLDPSS